MKKLKNVLALVFALVLTIAMAAPVMATQTGTDNGYSITINNDASGHTYEAYQILAGDLSGQTLSNVSWGSGINVDALAEAGLTTDAVAFAESLDGVVDKSDEANAVAAKLALALSTTCASTSDCVNGQYVISGLEAGYYLVKDKDGSLENTDDSYTLYIMAIVGNTTVNAKSDTVTSEKKVKDINDSTDDDLTDWQDSADYDIGDVIPFQLKGTLPDNYADYDSYYYEFSDEQSAGLTLNENSVQVIANNNGTETVITDGYVFTSNVADNGVTTFSVKFEDLKKVTTATIDKNTVIYVRYNSTLNENAVIGVVGNPNKSKLRFSNNPNNDGYGDTNWDTVIVFTYEVVVNKIDENEDPLAGAEFTLYKELKSTEGIAEEDIVVIDDKNYLVISTVAIKGVEDVANVFKFTGIDDGNYILRETVTPAGYNTISDITFVVTADHAVLSDTPDLTGLFVNGEVTDEVTGLVADYSKGTVTGDIINYSGSILPSTGGAGRVALYVVGGILVVAVGVILVALLRTRKNA